jgi:hypothetical protein
MHLLEVAGARSTEQQFMLLLSESLGEGHCSWVLMAWRLRGQHSCSALCMLADGAAIWWVPHGDDCGNSIMGHKACDQTLVESTSSNPNRRFRLSFMLLIFCLIREQKSCDSGHTLVVRERAHPKVRP